MGVKEGYQETEFGTFPVDWDLVPVGDLFTFKNGLNKAKQFFGYGTPIVNYMDVYNHPALRVSMVEGKVDVTPKEQQAYEVLKGDVFFTRTSETVDEIGTAAVMLDEAESTVFSGFVLRARPNDTSLVDAFKAYCFQPKYFRDQVTSRASYTTRALTNGKSLSRAMIARPPTNEQRAIASALRDIDDYLDQIEALIAKKRDLRNTVMRELVTGEKRLKGFSREWSVHRVKDFGQIVTGGTPSTGIAEYWGGDLPWVTPTDISDERDIHTTERMLTLEGLKKLRGLPSNSVLVTCIASIGKNAVLREAGGCNQQINAIVPNHEFECDFLFYLMEVSKEYLLANSGITATRILSKSSFEELEFKAPKIDEQKAISRVLADMDAEMEELKVRKSKIRDLSLAMKHDLLIGKTRIPFEDLAND